METIKKVRTSGDFVLLICTLALVIFGVIMVFSASYYTSLNNTGNAFGYLIKDGIYAVIGLAVMIFLSLLDYSYLKRFAPWILLAGVLLLIALLIPGVGTQVNGAVRWIRLGPISIMPGEMIKFCLIIFTAAYYGSRPRRIEKAGGIIPIILITGVCVLLIMLQPNMSTAMTVLLIVALMMVVAGLPRRWIIAGVGFVGLGVVLMLLSDTTGYRMQRIMSFTHPFDDALGDGYQVTQGLMAIGSGGLTGVGLGNSVQKNLYLPEPQNDFILAIIGEELGYIGIILLMIAFVVFVWRCVRIAVKAPDRFGMYVASGVAIMVGLQVILNIGVVTSVLPPTGVILPFISYGGNALIMFMACSGILINISRHEMD